MSDVSVPAPVPQPQTLSEALAQLPAVPPWYASATPGQREALELDFHQAVLKGGLEPAEYLAALVGQLEGRTVLDYLAEQDIPVQEPGPAADPNQHTEQTAEQVAAAQAATEAEAAARQEAALAEADRTCKAAVRAFAKGEREYRLGLLEAGRLAGEYLVQRMALRHPRENAVATLVGELARYASHRVDAAYVNRLVASYQAYRLLAVDTGLADSKAKAVKQRLAELPYSHYRDGWCRLVERRDKDTLQEHWVLIPGFEGDAKAAFEQAARDAVPLETVQGLVNRNAARQAEEAKAAKEAADAKAQAEREALEQAQQATRAALQAKAAAEEQAKRAADEAARARMTEAAHKAQLELEAAHRAQAEQQAKADAAAREAERKRRAEQAAREAREAAERKAAQAAERRATKGKGPKPPAEAAPALEPKDPMQVTGNLLKVADVATAQGLAEMLAAMTNRHEEPDTVLERYLALLVKSQDLSPKSIRACKNALALVRGKLGQEPAPAPSPSPLEVAGVTTPAAAPVNGDPAAA
jgi:hypothetical protein